MRIPVLLYLLAVAVRVLAAAQYPDPAYPDSYYYTEVARSLAAGRGFSVDFIWIFVEVGNRIPDLSALPVASNAHWMPLSSILAAPFVALFGQNPPAELASFVLLGALAAPLTWAIARDVGGPSWLAIGAGLIVAVPGMLMPFMAQPDNFGVYQPLVGAALWFGARGLRREKRLFALAGLLTGLATLARTDGALVLVALGLVFAGDRVLAWRSSGARAPSISLRSAAACVALFLLVVGPWWLRQLAVFGSISPSTATGKVLYLREFGEWNSLTIPGTLEWFLGQGLGQLLASRLGGLIAALNIYLVLGCSVVLAPFAILGAWLRRRSPDFMPFFAYALLLFAANMLLFAVHVPGGTFIHSAAGLMPYTTILALEGIVAVVAWVARRRPSWDADRTARVTGFGAVAFVMATAVPATLDVHASWDVSRQQHRQIAGALSQAGAAPGDRLMSSDASGSKYWTGLGGVVSPNDPIETIEQVARAYEIRWLAIVRDDGVAPLAPILNGTGTVPWIGPPVYASDRAGAPVVGVDGRPESGPTVAVALYPVCVAANESRCLQAAEDATP